MSVDYIETYKLANVVSVYRAGLHRFNAVGNSRGPTAEQFAGALVALHYANVMTLGLSYTGDAGNLAELIDPRVYYNLDPDNVGFVNPSDDAYRRWVVQVREIMLYNTITNDGIHCMPRKHEETVERAIFCILGGLASLWPDV